MARRGGEFLDAAEKADIAEIGESWMGAGCLWPQRAEIFGERRIYGGGFAIIEAVAEGMHDGAEDLLGAGMRAFQLIGNFCK